MRDEALEMTISELRADVVTVEAFRGFRETAPEFFAREWPPCCVLERAIVELTEKVLG
jgi:hypothetical protein